MSELLDQINTDANKETISVKELTKALETWFFDKQENISTMIAELDTIDNTLERSCVQSLLKVAYQSPLYDKLQQYPEFINRLQIWSQHSYLESLDIDEKQIGQISLYILPKKPEDITLTTLSKYVDLKNILPEYHDMILSVLQNQVKLFTQLCPDGKSLLDMKWNSKNNGLDASVLEFSTISSLSDRIKKEAQVRKDYETIKNHNVKQIDPWKITKDCLKLWTITKLSTLPTELAKLDTQSAFAQFLQKNQNDVFYWPILQQYISIRLQPYLRKEWPVEYVSATIDKENPELKNYIVGTAYGKQLIQHTSEWYKNYKEQQQTLAKFHLTGATPDQIATFQRKRNNHQARVKPEYLKTIQEQEDKFNHESVLRHSQSTRDSMPYIKKWSVDKYIYNSVLTLTKDYVTLLLQTPEGKKLLKEKKYIDNPFMPGMRLNFAKGNIDSIVRDSFFEKFWDGIDDFKKAWKEGKREEVGRSIGSLVWGTVAAWATTILTWWSGVWAAGAAFTIWSRAGWSLWGMIWAGFEGKSWWEIGNAWLVWLWVGERDQNGKFVNYFTDTKWNVTQASLLHGAWRMGISLGTDYLSSVATFWLGNKIGLDKRAGKFVGAWWKQLASKWAVFGAEELFIENFLVDIPANTLQAGVSSYVLGNAIQDVWPRSAKLTKNSNPDKQLDPNIPSDTKGDIKAALWAMKQTFAQNISPENLGQTFAATIAYGGMLEWGRWAINRVSVALPALSVKNINEISTAYQSHLSDLQTKFPTLSIGKDMSMLTLDGKLLDQTHPRFAELQWSLTALQSLWASFTQEMEKISQIQQQLTDPASLEAKKRWLIYGRKLLHPHMTPMEVLDSRIKKLQSEIASTKKSDIKAQKEAVLKQMEEVKETLADKKTIISDVVMSESEVGGKIEGNKGQVEEVSVDDKKSEVYLQVWPIKVNKTILSEQHKELLYKIPWAKDIVLWSHILDLHRWETSDASVVKAWFKALQEKLLQAKNNWEELPSHILWLSNLSFVLGKYWFSIFDSLPVEVYTQVWQYKRLFGEADPKNPLTPAELKQKERIWQYNNGKNPIKAAIIDIETFLKLNFWKEWEWKDLQQHELSNVNNIESINKALEELVHLIPTEILRRPNGSIGTQGFTEENFMSVARYIAQEMWFTIPVYDKKSNVSEISQLINYLKNNKEAQQKIKEYVIKDPVIVSLLPDNTYHIEDGNHRANLLNLIGVDVIPTIERNGRDKQDVIDEHNAKVQTIENMYWQNPAVAKQSQDIGNSHIEWINNLTTHYPDLLKNIVNPEKISQIIQNEINAWNLVLNPDGTIKEVLVEINGEKKPSQLFAKMRADWFSEQQALKTWLQVRTPEFKNRFGDWQSADKSQVSKVVDENGEPLVVYRGQNQQVRGNDFNNWNITEHLMFWNEWFFFTSDYAAANAYAKYKNHFINNDESIVYSCFIKSLNPLNVENHNDKINKLNELRLNEIQSENIKEINNFYGKYWIKINSEQDYINLYEEFHNFVHNQQSSITKYWIRIEDIPDSHKDVFFDWSKRKDYIGNNKISSNGIMKKYFTWLSFSSFHDNIEWHDIDYDQYSIFDPKNIKSAINNDWSFSPETAKFNDYFWKESRFWFDSKQAREHSGFMDQFTIQATPEQIAQIRQKIQAVAQIYTDKTWKKLELTDTQIQAIIDTHLLPWQLGQLTQAELKAKVAELATAIPDADVRRFLLEAGFCGMEGDIKPYDTLGISKDEYKEIIMEWGWFSAIDKLFEEKFGMKKNIYYFIEKHPDFKDWELRSYLDDLRSWDLEAFSHILWYYNHPKELKDFFTNNSNISFKEVSQLLESGIDFVTIKSLHLLWIFWWFDVAKKIIKIKNNLQLEDLINNYKKFWEIKEISSIKTNYLSDKILLIYEKWYTFDTFQKLLWQINQLWIDSKQREKIVEVWIDNYKHLKERWYDVVEIGYIIENESLLDYCLKNNTKLDARNIHKFMNSFSWNQYKDILNISQFIDNAKVSYSLDWMAKIIKENNIDMFEKYQNFNEAKSDILQQYIIPLIDKKQITQSDLTLWQKREYVKNKNEFAKEYTLTESEYQNLFLYEWSHKKSELSQWYIWNCRLIAYMNNFRMRNFFESVVRSSITKTNDWYEVTMPLWAKNGKKITIHESDLSTYSTDDEGATMYRSNTYRSTHRRNNIDSQEFEQQFKKWFTLLEIAFAKYIANSDVADANAINGTQSNLNEIYDEEALIDNRFILSKQRIDFSNMNPQSLQDMYNALIRFKQWNYIISPHIAHTIEDQKLENSKTEEYLPAGHAYSLSDVSIDSKWDIIITVTNPWDTKNLNTKFTLQEFLNFFNGINVSEIDLQALFEK